MTRNSLQMTSKNGFVIIITTLNYANVVSSCDFETVTEEAAKYYDFN